MSQSHHSSASEDQTRPNSAPAAGPQSAPSSAQPPAAPKVIFNDWAAI